MGYICDKLPPVLNICDGENYESFIERIYLLYLENIANARLSLFGKPIKTKTELTINMRQMSFDHITCSQDKNEQNNRKRSKRIMWIPAIITLINRHDCCENICCWYEKSRSSKGARDYIIWCKPLNYVIVLGEKKGFFILRSAYIAFYSSKKYQLEKSWGKNKPS